MANPQYIGKTAHKFTSLGMWMVKVLLIAITYFFFAKLSEVIMIPPGNVSLVWLPSGIAFVSLVVFGARVWPSVFLGSLTYNFLFFTPSAEAVQSNDILFGLIVGVGATLQAIISLYCCRQLFSDSFESFSINQAFKTIILAGPVGCVINASFGTFALWLTGKTQATELFNTWVTWWFGDVLGVVGAIFIALTVYKLYTAYVKPGVNKQYGWHLLSILTVLICLVGTLWSWSAVRNETSIENHYRFENLVDEAENKIKNRLYAYQDILWGGVGLFKASNSVERQEWRSYVDSLDLEQRLPGILGIGYIDQVNVNQLERYISDARDDDEPSFHLKRVGEGNGAHENHFIIKEPLNRTYKL